MVYWLWLRDMVRLQKHYTVSNYTLDCIWIYRIKNLSDSQKLTVIDNLKEEKR